MPVNVRVTERYNREWVGHPEYNTLRDALWLIKQGIPYYTTWDAEGRTNGIVLVIGNDHFEPYFLRCQESKQAREQRRIERDLADFQDRKLTINQVRAKFDWPAIPEGDAFLQSGPVIFLDVDGVLNDHKMPLGVMCGQIHKEKVELLNHVLTATGANIVLSSAWRYLVHRGEVNLQGLDWLFRSHGLLAGRLVGITRPDSKDWDGDITSYRHTQERGAQIQAYLDQHPCSRYVVVDDLDLGITAAGHPFVHCDGQVGLTELEAEILIEKLRLPLVPAPDYLLTAPEIDAIVMEGLAQELHEMRKRADERYCIGDNHMPTGWPV